MGRDVIVLVMYDLMNTATKPFESHRIHHPRVRFNYDFVFPHQLIPNN